MNKYDLAKDLIDFIDRSPSAFQAVENIKERLTKEGFTPLSYEESWKLSKGGKYFVEKNDSAIIAFVVGEGEIEEHGFKIISSHTDSPGFKVKPSPYIKSNGYLKLNTESYGGPILNTWLDRPLSLAGRVTLKSGNPLKPKNKVVDLKKPILIIPNLAIHLNKNVNSGIELNKQIDTLPLLGIIEDSLNNNDYIINEISSILGVKNDEILDFELFLYAVEKGSIIGMNNEFISASRLDDLAMAHASLEAIINSSICSATKVFVCFDNEEIGSATKQGGDSKLLSNTLERIALSLNKTREDFLRSISHSFMISADLAHAVHPNRSEKHDPILRPIINKGPVIKVSSSGSYTTDSFSSAVYEEICKGARVPFQKFCNRSDERGGSTLGPISSTQLEINTVDMGSPVLAMHSIRELAGVDDHEYVLKSFSYFYSI
ncbi:M18 family aminopeptidase [Clostridium cylindrosporum]|uniref:M18 family aminopeptidase n=1 Tax=Clostridium cylindrosporum DSM 605 TaxID=1121307 RepID=A0A0J8D5M4_CLOCY|nr:M18 family aminopeptidase [Clostridium cylindrosporum]KMT21137.1 M18 family aminopeptidase 2 [Clostridium cylindrosporum DSM 605]